MKASAFPSTLPDAATVAKDATILNRGILAGSPLTDEVIDGMISQIKANPLLDGITFSGGDPFYHSEAFLPVIRKFREQTGLNIWCYTGYTYEELVADPLRRPILGYIDVLVDGRFEQSLYSPRLEFRGSSNQRILKLKSGVPI